MIQYGFTIAETIEGLCHQKKLVKCVLLVSYFVRNRFLTIHSLIFFMLQRNDVIVTGNPCPICRDEYLVVDYKNTDLLKQFISPHTGEIISYK